MDKQRKLTIVLDMKQNATGVLKSIMGGFAGLTGAMTISNLATKAVTKAMDLLKRGLGEIVDAIVDSGAKFAMMDTALEQIASNVGVSARELAGMKAELREVNTWGSKANNVLRSLLQSEMTGVMAEMNLSLGDLTLVMKDFAATAQTTSGEAIQDFTTAIQRLSPLLIDKYFQMRNLNAVYSDAAEKIGVNVAELTNYEKRMAFMNEIMKEGAKVQGVYNEVYDTSAKNMLSMKDATESLKETFGAAFEPVLRQFTGTLLGFLKDLLHYFDSNSEAFTRFITVVSKGLGFMGADLETTLDAFVDNLDKVVIAIGEGIKLVGMLYKGLHALGNLSKALNTVFYAPFNAIVEGAKYAINVVDKFGKAWEKVLKGEDAGVAIQQFNNTVTGGWKQMTNNINNYSESFMEGLKGAWQDTGDVLEMSMLDVEGTWKNVLNNTKKGTHLLGSAFSKTADEVQRKMTGASDKVKKEYEKMMDSIAKKTKAFREELKDLVMQHRDKTNELKKDLKAERAERDKEIEAVKESYEEQLTSLEKALYREKTSQIEGSEERIKVIEEEMDRIEGLRDEEIEDVKDQYDERIKALQEELDKEMEIQKKHAQEFAKFKDAIKEDDITRLKNKFKEEMEELKKQGQERMTELRTQGRKDMLSYSSGAKEAMELTTGQKLLLGILKWGKKYGLKPTKDVPAWAEGFQHGGIIEGRSNDQTVVRASDGEMILNQEQQARLFEMANGSGGSGGVTINVDNYYGDAQGLRNLAERIQLELNRLNFAGV